jgi:adenosylcobinamide-GDP ribazoletransferase
MFRHLAIAVSFLTIFPLPRTTRALQSPSDLAGSFVFFPLVGALLGACWLVTAHAASGRIPPPLHAVFLTGLMVALTRGLHLDGLADFVDGVGGAYSRERRLQIMKDSRLGTFGALALMVVVGAKIASLEALLETSRLSELLVIPIFSRYALVLGAYKSRQARPEGGLGHTFSAELSARHVLTASLFVVGAFFLSTAHTAAVFLLATAVCVALLRFCAARWLGGITGDVLGALNEVTETVLLSLAAVLP